jgi:predicted site-specific integrase-resolvase
MNSRQEQREQSKPLLRPQDVQRALGVCRRTYQRYLKEGLTASYSTPHGHRRFTETDVERFREQLRERVSA